MSKAVSLEKAELRKCGKGGCKRYQFEPFCSKHQQEPAMKYYKQDKNIVPRSNPATMKEQAS